ncbi:hypothetical protein [Alsobacter sp. R-9]
MSLERNRLRLEQEKAGLERARLELERSKVQLETLKVDHEQARAASTITNQYALQALRSVLLINGAACIAVLSFLGSRSPGMTAAKIADAVDGATFFAGGVATAAAGSVLAYYSRVTHSRDPKRWWTYGLEAFAGLLGIAALVAFPLGARSIAGAFTMVVSQPSPQSNVTIHQ